MRSLNNSRVDFRRTCVYQKTRTTTASSARYTRCIRARWKEMVAFCSREFLWTVCVAPISPLLFLLCFLPLFATSFFTSLPPRSFLPLSAFCGVCVCLSLALVACVLPRCVSRREESLTCEKFVTPFVDFSAAAFICMRDASVRPALNCRKRRKLKYL